MNGFLLFHSITEAFTIVMAGSLFVTVWTMRTYRVRAAIFFLTVGIGFLFVGTLDLAHTLAYKGMNVFTAYDADLPTQLWVAARYLQSLTLLGAALLLLMEQRKHRHLSNRAAYYLLASFTAVTALLLLAVFSRHFPACYVTGAGLTPFKRVSEYVISLILAGTSLLLWRARDYFNRETVVYLIAAVVTSILSELSFTLYTDVYGAFNVIGHVLKIVAFALLYRSIVQTNLRFLGDGERRFHLLFENMPDGYAVHEIICDAQGRPCDYRFLEVNPAYEALTGLKASDIIGKTVLQVLPDLEPEWIKRYGRVALGGSPIRFDHPARALNKHFEVSAYAPMPGQFATVVLDITERKKMEDELRESENRFRAVFDQAAVGVALLNTRTGQYVRVNQRYCDFLGYTIEEMLQKNLMDVTFHEDIQQNIEANAQLIDGSRKDFSYEKRYIRRDGSLVWGSLTISPLWKPGEKPATYLHIAVVQDITERKKMEEELRRDEEQYRTLFTSMDLGVFYFHPGGTITFANPAALNILGVTRDEISSLQPTDARWRNIHEDGSEFTDESLPSTVAMRTGQAVRDAIIGIYNERERAYRWVLGSALPRFGAGETTPSLVYVTMMDITQRKSDEEALVANQATLVEAQAIAHIGDWSMDTATRTFVWSPEMYVVHGIQPGTPVSHETYLRLVHPDDRHHVFDAIQAAIAGWQQEFSVDYRIVRPDGNMRFVSLTGKTVVDDRGIMSALRGTMQDITDRKKAEQEKVFLQEQLMGSRKLEAVGQLAGGVAHNFNNLLTGIMGSIEIARMDIPPTSPATASLENAHSAAVKAAGLARQLLSFSRNAMIAPAMQNANVLVESALELVSSSLPGSLEIVRDLSPDAWDVMADSSELTRLLLELVKNACEAMENKGTVTVRTRNVTVGDAYVDSRSFARTGAFVVISVADTGPGIAPEVMKHLFEPFATTRQFGRGMGLATVFGSIKQAGGWVDVASDHGAGTEVSLYLPRYVEQH